MLEWERVLFNNSQLLCCIAEKYKGIDKFLMKW